MNTKSNYKSSGFTLVELIIVIVIVAVLAAVALVSYNNVSARARQSSVRAMVDNVAKDLIIEQTNTGVYPDSLTAKLTGVVGELDDNVIYNYIPDPTDKTKACFSITDEKIKYAYSWTTEAGKKENYVCQNNGTLAAYTNAVGGSSSGGGIITTTPTSSMIDVCDKETSEKINIEEAAFDAKIHRHTTDGRCDAAWKDPKTHKLWSYPVINDGGVAKFATEWKWYSLDGSDDCNHNNYKNCQGLWSYDGSGYNGSYWTRWNNQQYTTNAKGKTAAQICEMMDDGGWRLPADRAELKTAYNNGLKTANPIAGGTADWPGNGNRYFWTGEITSSTNAWFMQLSSGTDRNDNNNSTVHIICVR